MIDFVHFASGFASFLTLILSAYEIVISTLILISIGIWMWCEIESENVTAYMIYTQSEKSPKNQNIF